jgi:hypothetical protein
VEKCRSEFRAKAKPSHPWTGAALPLMALLLTDADILIGGCLSFTSGRASPGNTAPHGVAPSRRHVAIEFSCDQRHLAPLAARASAAGANAILEKPYTDDALKSAIERAMGP